MNGFQSPTYFDALALGVVAGSLLLLLIFVWALLDRRVYEDPLRRRERGSHEDVAPDTGGAILPDYDSGAGSAARQPEEQRRARQA